MAVYLRNWVESSKDLPAELVRCFKLMQELDQRSHALQQSVNCSAAEQLERASKLSSSKAQEPATKRLKLGEGSGSAVPALQLDEKTEADMKEVLRIADEKVSLAHQIYDFVDKNICRLDKDLKSFDEELQRERARLGVPEPELALAEPRRRKQRVSALEGRRGAPEPLELATTGGGVTQVDPNEPTYCYCNRVSFGEMIGCDNPDCSIEWFHFECVGIPLDGRPKGKWYCKDCLALKKAGKIK